MNMIEEKTFNTGSNDLLDCRLLQSINFNCLNLKLVFQVMGFGKIHECLELTIEE
jgi:hypothetical protein